MIYIETERLILRTIVESDAKDISFLSTRPIVRHFMSDMVFEKEEDALSWVKWVSPKMNDVDPCMLLAVVIKGGSKVIGYMGVAPKKELNNEIEILYAVSDEYQGMGYATEAGEAIIRWAFEVAGVKGLSAIVKPENRASRRVIEKLGFMYIDTRILPYDGEDCAFDYFNLQRPEKMDDFFNARLEGYHEHMLKRGDMPYQKLGEAIPGTDEPISILDLGCGTGIELSYIFKRAPKAHITCVDMTPAMLGRLVENYPDNRAQISTVEASYLEMDYPEAKYDMVVSSATMHHLFPAEKVRVYRNIYKTLKPGGLYVENDFIVDDADAKKYRRRYEVIISNLAGSARAGEYHIDIPCTLREQHDMLREAGFFTSETFFSDIKSEGSFAILRGKKKVTSKDISSRFWSLPQKPEEEVDRENTFIDDIISKAHIEREIRSHLDGIKTAFDGGAGYGRFSLLLAKRGVKVVHFDISLPMIEKAKKLAEEAGVIENMTFAHGALEDLSAYRDGQFDMVLSFDAPISYTYPNHQRVIGELARICSKRIILGVYSRLAWTYQFDPGQKVKYVLDENTKDPLARWSLDTGAGLVKNHMPDMKAVRRFFGSGLMESPEATSSAYEKGETPWPVSYGFMPDELIKTLAENGVKDIKLAGPGALSRSIPGAVLRNIMTNSVLKQEFLDFCYWYDSQIWCAGMGKDNILASGEVDR